MRVTPAENFKSANWIRYPSQQPPHESERGAKPTNQNLDFTDYFPGLRLIREMRDSYADSCPDYSDPGVAVVVLPFHPFGHF